MGTLHRLTCTWIGLGTVVFAACAKSEKNEGMETTAAVTSGATTAAATTPAAAPAAGAPVNLASVAGKWNLVATPDSGKDMSPTHAVITAASGTSGWTMTFPGRPPLPMRVSTGGDSIVTDVGPYASVRRKNVQVTTHGVMRLQNDRLVGQTVAHYAVKTADSMMTLHTEATRAK